VIDVGEYGLALEDMAGMLAYREIAIADQERGDMLALAGRMNAEGDAVRRAIESCPRAERQVTSQNMGTPRHPKRAGGAYPWGTTVTAGQVHVSRISGSPFSRCRSADGRVLTATERA